MTEPLIELRNVSKHFAGVKALTDVSIAVHPGEVVCLLGDNGAGKSTLIKILSGFHPPSSGSIYLDGQETRFADPRDARSRGIATVHQEVGTIPLMSVGRNFFLGAELKKGRPPFRWLDTERCNSIALEQIRKFRHHPSAGWRSAGRHFVRRRAPGYRDRQSDVFRRESADPR